MHSLALIGELSEFHHSIGSLTEGPPRKGGGSLQLTKYVCPDVCIWHLAGIGLHGLNVCFGGKAASSA
jgi:hypothetical protein